MLPNSKKRKLGSKTSDCMFIGYVEHNAAYRFLILKSDMLDCNTIVETKNGEFLNMYFFWNKQVFPIHHLLKILLEMFLKMKN